EPAPLRPEAEEHAASEDGESEEYVPDGHQRQQLPHDDLERGDRQRQRLLERSTLALADDAERDAAQADVAEQHAGEDREEEVAIGEGGIEPEALADVDGTARAPAGIHLPLGEGPSRIEARGDLADVGEYASRAHRVGAVHQELDLGMPA